MADIEKPTGLDWIELRKDMQASSAPEETGFERILGKLKKNPLVPAGTALTVGALSYGIYNFYLGKRQMQQYMMRLRVAAQLFTVVAAVSGIMYNLPPEKRNIYDLIKSGEKFVETPE